MGDSNDVIGRIRQELEQLEERREKLLHALEVLSDLGLTDTKIPEGVDPRILSAGGTTSGNGNDPLDRDDLPLLDASLIVVRQEGHPLSIPEIATRLIGSSYPYDKDEDTLRRSLSGVLGRWARKGERVFRPETGKYAPMEWMGEDEQLSIDD